MNLLNFCIEIIINVKVINKCHRFNLFLYCIFLSITKLSSNLDLICVDFIVFCAGTLFDVVLFSLQRMADGEVIPDSHDNTRS